jgi:hypothetical protein
METFLLKLENPEATRKKTRNYVMTAVVITTKRKRRKKPQLDMAAQVCNFSTRLRLDNDKFKSSLGHLTIPYLKKQKQNKPL